MISRRTDDTITQNKDQQSRVKIFWHLVNARVDGIT